MEKRENPILTHSNVLFYPLAARQEEILIADVAHALSHICRANGHFETFYSVAQHSLNCRKEAEARQLPKRVQLACLLHDGSEAYLSDVTRPVKIYLPEYREIEGRLQQLIYERFALGDLTQEEFAHVDAIDNTLLYYEFDKLHQQGLNGAVTPLRSKPDVSERKMSEVKSEFLHCFQCLSGNVK